MTDAKDVGEIVKTSPVAWVHPMYLENGALGIECSSVQLGPSQVPLYSHAALLALAAENDRLTQENAALRERLAEREAELGRYMMANNTLGEKLVEADSIRKIDCALVTEYQKRAQQAEALAERNKEDAEKWQAFVGCARIRVVGSAGIHEPVPGDERWVYAHMGLELWTISQAGSAPDAVEQIEVFLDKVRAARGKP